MDAEELEAAVALLLSDAEGEQGDKHELYQRLHQLLARMRATGMPIPEDLARLEAALDQD